MRVDSYLKLLEHIRNPEVANNMGDHIFLLYELVVSYKDIKQPKVLELGTGKGGSLVPLALGCQDTNGLLISIDKSGEYYQELIKTINLFRLTRIVLIYGDDTDIQTIHKIKRYGFFDIIFIDTSHEYKHTLKELGIYSKLLNKDGFIILHDSSKKLTEYYGIRRAIDNFLKRSKLIKILDKESSCGLTILKKI